MLYIYIFLEARCVYSCAEALSARIVGERKEGAGEEEELSTCILFFKKYFSISFLIYILLTPAVW